MNLLNSCLISLAHLLARARVYSHIVDSIMFQFYGRKYVYCHYGLWTMVTHGFLYLVIKIVNKVYVHVKFT